MSEKGSEPDIEPRRFNVAEVPLADIPQAQKRDGYRQTRKMGYCGNPASTSSMAEDGPAHLQPARKTCSMSASGVPILARNSRLSDSRSRRLTSRPMFIWISANCLRSCS
jgi:hypothetical protein